MKHSPSPWTIDKYTLCIEDADGYSVGYAENNIKPEQAQIDVKVMAAAPDLLSALQDLFGADMEYFLMMDGKPDQIAAIAKAHAAIAKATL